MKTNKNMVKVYDVNEKELKLPDGWVPSYVCSPIYFIGDEIGNFTDFVNNIYKVCELQGHYSLISEKNIPEPWNPQVIVKERVALVPIPKERTTLIPNWDKNCHLFRIVRQELAVRNCKKDREISASHCILSGWDYRRQKKVKGHYLVVNTTESKVEIKTDLDIKEDALGPL